MFILSIISHGSCIVSCSLVIRCEHKLHSSFAIMLLLFTKPLSYCTGSDLVMLKKTWESSLLSDLRKLEQWKQPSGELPDFKGRMQRLDAQPARLTAAMPLLGCFGWKDIDRIGPTFLIYSVLSSWMVPICIWERKGNVSDWTCIRPLSRRRAIPSYLCYLQNGFLS